MEQELDHLQQRLDSLVGLSRSLAERNRTLSAQLEQAARDRIDLEARMEQARQRVLSVMSRLGTPQVSTAGE